MENMKLWKSVCVTDPAAVKPITGKQYKGNSPKPYWIVERLTEIFGPCGKGWGFKIVNERFERLTSEDVLHVACVSFWHSGDKDTAFEQMGQTKAVYMTAKGSLMVDEDAPKKSVTDALVKCASYLGFAGDIFSGRWDDSKYVEWAAEETRRRETPTLNDEQVTEISTLLQGRDFEAFMAWVSKCVGQECKALKDVPAEAYKPIIKKLTQKAQA